MKMIRLACVICMLIALAAFGQEEASGVSKPGKIVKISKTAQVPLNTEKPVIQKTVLQEKGSKIQCEISFEEPSGDGILSEGEKGAVKVVVSNSSENPISPNLRIEIQPSWSQTGTIANRAMTSIEPGASTTYRSVLNWDSRMKDGTIQYNVVATDIASGFKSDPMKISFSVRGASEPSEGPVLVDVDSQVPKTYGSNPYAVAVVIGNKDYVNPDIPDVEYAVNDSKTMKQYLVNMLGFRDANILYMENATKSDFETFFGTREYPEGKLFNFVKANQSDVFVYYAGHGAPDIRNNRAYFMPVNADPNYIQINGYPLDLFYQNLGKIAAKSVTVVLDACFSGGSAQGMLIKKASPIFIEVNMPVIGSKGNILASSTGAQISSWYPEGKHSLFTYYLLRGMRGEADGDKNREITISEMQNYLQDQVPYTARRLYGREQTPVVKGAADYVLCKY